LVAADFRALPFLNQCFDAVFSIHVVYHASRIGMQKALDEVRRVLKPGGLFVGTLISTRAWKYGMGQPVERDTFIQPEGPETGVAHHYADEGDARDLMRAFRIESLDHEGSRTIDNHLDYHWEVVAIRR
jgi:tellurite methyltransferase